MQPINVMMPTIGSAGNEYVGDQSELYLLDEQPGEGSPCERLLGNAMAGEGAHFARADCVEAAWATVDPVLTKHHRTVSYKPGSWGPKVADALIAASGGWHNPVPEAELRRRTRKCFRWMWATRCSTTTVSPRISARACCRRSTRWNANASLDLWSQ